MPDNEYRYVVDFSAQESVTPVVKSIDLAMRELEGLVEAFQQRMANTSNITAAFEQTSAMAQRMAASVASAKARAFVTRPFDESEGGGSPADILSDEAALIAHIEKLKDAAAERDAERVRKDEVQRERIVERSEAALTRAIETGVQARSSLRDREAEQGLSTLERGLLNDLAAVERTTTRITQALQTAQRAQAEARNVPVTQLGQSPAMMTGLLEVEGLAEQRNQLERRLVEARVEREMAAARSRARNDAEANETIELQRMASEQRVAQIVARGVEQEIIARRAGEREIEAWDARFQTFTQHQTEAVDAAETRMTQTVTQAAQRRAQAEEQANERYMQTLATATARMSAVSERAEGSRVQVGAAGAQGRLQRLLESEGQMSRVVEEAGNTRLRLRAQTGMREAETVAQAAEQRVRMLREIEGVGDGVILTAEIAALDARSHYEQLQTQVVQHESAERTRIEREAVQAQAELQRQIAAERTTLATAAVGGGGGGGFFGGIGTLVGGFGGAGGFFGGAASAITGAAGSILGAASNIPGALLGGLQTGVSALTAPVRGLVGLFKDMATGITGAAGSLTQFLLIGAGLYTVYQIVDTLRSAIVGTARGALDFQDSIVKVGSLTGATSERIREMSAGILEVSMTTGRSAVELGQAMYFIESHGVHGSEAMVLLGNSAKLAAAGLGDTDQIVRVVAGQLLAYGETVKGAGEFTRIAGEYFDVFARTVQISAVPADEVAKTFARLTPLTAALHIPVKEVGADFATISQTGLNASRVMTDLIAVFNQFLQGSQKQRDALKSIGLSLTTVRNTLTDQGLIAATSQIWEASGHDIDKVSQIFGDRTRALIGYLALIEDGGRRANENLKLMQDSAGTTTAVFEASLTRVSVQWQRFESILQAGMIIITSLGSNALGGLADDLNAINDALQQGDFGSAVGKIGKLFQDVSTTALNVLDTLANSMFGAGAKLMEQLAGGIIAGANSIITSAVNYVADLIASFLLGHSPPPRGPLSYMTEGVRRWTESYAETMRASGDFMASAATEVAQQVNTELGKIGAINAGGYSEATVKQKIANLDAELLPWKNAAQDIKDRYDDMLRPLDAQIQRVRDLKDLEYERQEIVLRQRGYELDMLKLRAEGDPVKRAQLAGQIARAQEISERHSIDARIATINREMHNLRPGRGVTAQELTLRRRELNDELTMLKLQKQQHQLVNVELLGQYNQKKATLDFDKQGATLEHDSWQLQKDITLQPLIDQHDKIATLEKTELDQINDQTRALEQQRAKWQAIEQQISAAKTAAKSAGGDASPWVLPTLGDDAGVGVAQGLNARVQDMANSMVARFQAGFDKFAADYGPTIGQGFIGFIVGGMVGGLPGAIAGAQLAPKLVQALTDRDITAADFTGFATRVQTGLQEAWDKARVPLSAGDLFGTVDSLVPSIHDWIGALDKAFFREWTVSRVPMGPNAEPSTDVQSTLKDYSATTEGQRFIEANIGGIGTQRYTGLGRTLIEKLFGQQDANLNYQVAYDMLNKNIFQPIRMAVQAQIAEFFAPSIEEAAGGMPVQGPSQFDKLLEMFGGMLNKLRDAIVAFTPVAGEAARGLGYAVTDGIFTAMETAFRGDPPQTLIAAVLNLGGTIGVKLGEGMVEAIWQKLTDEFLHPHPERLLALPAVLKTAFATQTTSKDVEPLPGMPLGTSLTETPPDVKNAYEVGQQQRDKMATESTPGAGNNDMLLQIYKTLGGDTINAYLSGWIEAGKDMGSDIVQWFNDNVIDPAKSAQALDSHSPSRTFEEMGRDTVRGYNAGISESAALTAPVVRMWLDNNVIDVAKSILLTDSGTSGGSNSGVNQTGLGSVAQAAIKQLNDAFAGQPDKQLTNSLNALGRGIVHEIMDPITDARTGLKAQFQDVIDRLPKAPKSTTAPTPRSTPPGTGDAPPDIPSGAPYAAIGGDYEVAGYGGTDSKLVSLHATPGELVRVTSSARGDAAGTGGDNGGTREVHLHGPLFNVENLHAGDRQEVDGMLDHVREFLVNDIKTARGQGVRDVNALTPRGSR